MIYKYPVYIKQQTEIVGLNILNESTLQILLTLAYNKQHIVPTFTPKTSDIELEGKFIKKRKEIELIKEKVQS